MCAKAAPARHAPIIGAKEAEKHFMAETVLVWLRNDLRTADNPALTAAMARGERVVAVHVEETDKRLRARGAASVRHTAGGLPSWP